MNMLVLVIYPRLSSTTIAVYDHRKEILLTTIKHQPEILETFASVAEQLPYRKSAIAEELEKAGISLAKISIVVGRGGLLKPIPGGIYNVNEAMLKDSLNPMGEHESNLGGLLASELARESGSDAQAIISDPACVDEMDEVSKISGMPEITRKSIIHTLNQRTVARRFAREIGKNYEDINVIVAHIGKSTSVGAHRKGEIIDVNNGLIGDGPMSAERSGSVPAGDLVEMCFSGKFTKKEMIAKLKGKGGVQAYLGTSEYHTIEKRIDENDRQAELIFTALAYQTAKEIASLSAALEGNIDGILITGDYAYSQFLITNISKRVQHLGTVRVYPGENETEALAMYGYMVLDGEIQAKEYE